MLPDESTAVTPVKMPLTPLAGLQKGTKDDIIKEIKLK